MANGEHAPINPESGGEKQPFFERSPEIQDKKAERGAEDAPEKVERAIEQAKAEANKEAISGREVNKGEHKAKHTEPTIITSASRKESYNHTMKQIQSEMSAPARAFSKVIHNPAVERISDTVGNTVARPDAILSGSLFAFVLVLALYLMARHYGFALSGFETIAAFVIGWGLGIIFDLIRSMIAGKRN